jgi:hypothetical protein
MTYVMCFPQDLTAAKDLQPDDKAILAEHARIRKLVNQSFQKEATKYAKMFA